MKDLALIDIRKDFGPYRALEQVSLSFATGKLTALLGPSGCGKTTLLRIIAGLEEPTAGKVMLSGLDITCQPAHKRKFGMVFQNFALFPHLNVRDNTCYSLTIGSVPKTIARRRADELLDLVKLSGMGDRRIHELSGGQRQRVAIARALAQEPEIFLLDEPMSALDAKLREDMQVELRMLQQELGITTIVVTHDQREALTIADSIVVMSNGRIEQAGSPQDVYQRPTNAFVAGFIGKINFLDGVAKDGGVECGSVRLSVSPLIDTPDGVPLTVACRPERVRLDRSPTKSNSLPAWVEFVRNVGSTCEVLLGTELGKVVAECSLAEGWRSYEVGEQLFVHLAPTYLHVYSRN